MKFWKQLRYILGWPRALLEMVSQYRRHEIGYRAILRWRDGRVQEVHLPVLVDQFHIPKILVGWVGPDDAPSSIDASVSVFNLKHVWRDTGIAYFEEVGEGQASLRRV